MPEPKTPGNPNEVIDVVNAKGEGARIREKDFEAWSAKGFVRGTTFPTPAAPADPATGGTPPPADPPPAPTGGDN